MPKWKVTVVRTTTWILQVEAETENEATQRADQIPFSKRPPGSWEERIEEVEEVK